MTQLRRDGVRLACVARGIRWERPDGRIQALSAEPLSPAPPPGSIVPEGHPGIASRGPLRVSGAAQVGRLLYLSAYQQIALLTVLSSLSTWSGSTSTSCFNYLASCLQIDMSSSLLQVRRRPCPMVRPPAVPAEPTKSNHRTSALPTGLCPAVNHKLGPTGYLAGHPDLRGPSPASESDAEGKSATPNSRLELYIRGPSCDRPRRLLRLPED